MIRILFDLEGNGFVQDISKLHCVCTVNVDTGERRTYGPNQIKEAIEYLSTADVLIAHNGLRYDFPVLEKLCKFFVPLEKKLDTLVIARLKHPDIKDTDARWNATRAKRGLPPMGDKFGSHSIEAWGLRLGIHKLHTDLTDWSEWTQEIQDRCEGDIETNFQLWKFLEPDKYSQQAIVLEHRVAVLCDKIEQAGWPFNIERAGELHAKLVTEKNKLEVELKRQFGGWWIDKGLFTPKRPNKKMGYWGEWSEDKKTFTGYPCTKIEWNEFNPKSRQDIAYCLKKLGWKPKEFTDNGAPKLDETVIEGLAEDFPQSAGLATLLMVEKRLGQLADGEQAWLKVVQPDGCVHAQYNPMGAVTSRAAHFRPNIAQVPAVSSPYGVECRGLFGVLPGWEMIGADMEGLELRCLAHYMAKHDGGSYAEQILGGDVHWLNVLAMGLIESCERDKYNQLHTLLREQGAKRFLYAFIYGAGDLKAGLIILEACRLAKGTNAEWGFVYEKFFGTEGSPSEKTLRAVGSRVKREFMLKTPGLEKLIRQVQGIADSGRITGLDKRWLPVRSQHAALNTLLQSAGAILCKQWICDAYDALIAEGFKWGWDGDFVFLGWIHDELQVACRNGLGDRIGATLTRCAREAGAPFGFRVRLDSAYKVGNDWSQTH